MSFDPIEHVRENLVPLLSAIVISVEEEGNAQQASFFRRVRGGLETADDPVDLAEPFMELSAAAFMGFDYSPPVAMLLDQLLMHASQLTEALSIDDDEVH